ncbi:NAD-dependent epimerase/dehydratase family protein [Listeria booriae]|uniref:NAD-dependent epimerase/dehydratase family protein n=1 Tax=Listeria booriae TaxID=1552123 RepID=A0A841Y713_9LIST|nr:NAD-dependent epimerase/dehydratase family protein [Listeria booriae]MBC1372004.1 NAD-dependent epimerase/dehydratase family protein [Listeria booriae]
MRKKRFLITGGCGFIGSQVLQNLLKTPHEIFVIDNLSTGDWSWILERRIDLKICDIRSTNALEYILDVAPHYVIHLAAQTDIPTSIEQQHLDADINILGTLNVMLACKKVANFERFVFASSAAVYGNNTKLPLKEESQIQPQSPYGMSKSICEQYLSLNKNMDGFPYCALRFANVYGNKRQDKKDVISNFWDEFIQQRAPTIFGSGRQTRDFIFVDDIAEALILAIDIKDSGVYNVSTNEQTSINEVFQRIGNLLQIELDPVRKAPRLGDVYSSCLSNQKFRAATGWKPAYTLQTGLEKLREIKMKETLHATKSSDVVI